MEKKIEIISTLLKQLIEGKKEKKTQNIVHKEKSDDELQTEQK